MGRDELPQGVGAARPASHRSIQNAYSLVNRSFEIGLSEITFREQVSLLSYSPLGQGYLTGKYADGALPPDSRKTLFDRLGRYEKANGPKAISTYVALARTRRGADGDRLCRLAAIRHKLHHRRDHACPAQSGYSAADLKLPEHVLADIEQIHLDYPNPCP